MLADNNIDMIFCATIGLIGFLGWVFRDSTAIEFLFTHWLPFSCAIIHTRTVLLSNTKRYMFFYSVMCIAYQYRMIDYPFDKLHETLHAYTKPQLFITFLMFSVILDKMVRYFMFSTLCFFLTSGIYISILIDHTYVYRPSLM